MVGFLQALALGVCYILVFTVLMLVVAFVLMVTWIQVKEETKKESEVHV